MTKTDELLQAAVSNHQDGDLVAAMRLYYDALSLDPRRADAWNLVGVVAHQIGQQHDAIENIQRAISLDNGVADYHLNLAAAFLAAGQPQQAEESCRACLTLRPECPEALNSLGNALAGLGRLDEAQDAFLRALKICPGMADAASNLGRLLYSLGKLDEAERYLQQAVEGNPHHYHSLNNLGLIHRHRGRYERAIDCYSRALEIQPNSPEILVNLGNVLRQASRFEEALDSLTQATQLRPDHANSWCALGLVQQDLGRNDEALQSLRRAVELDPQDARAGSNLLFFLNLRSDLTREQVFEEHRQWGQWQKRDDPAPVFANPVEPDRRLRVGYVSPDLRQHALVSFFEPVLAGYDREAFEVTCYAEVAVEDQQTAMLRSLADRWRSTRGLSDAQVADQIRDDGIDILVDLAGHTANNRLPVFARKPAPIQISAFGYPNTTGLDAVDYYITDPLLVPSEEDRFFTEQVVRLPNGGHCWKPPAAAPEIAPPPVLKNGFITFGSMHRLDKLTDATLDLWARVLHSQPNARLLIFRDSLGQSPAIRAAIWQRLKQRGVCDDQVDLGWEFEGTHLTIYNSIDILLEVLPWGGGTTTYESLWMGVPIPGIDGDGFSRSAAVVALGRLGLTDLLASTQEEYIEVVGALSSDPDRLARLRRELRDSMRKTVCDSARYVRELEEAYRDMWRKWCRHSSVLESAEQDAPTTTWPIIYREDDHKYAPNIETWVDALESKQTTIPEISSQCHVPEETVIHAISCLHFDIGEVDAARQIVEEYLKHASDPVMHSQYLRCLMASPNATKKQFFEENLKWAKRFASDAHAACDSDFMHYDLDPNRKLRIGFLCGYACSALFRAGLLPLLKNMDRDAFEVMLFNLGQTSPQWLLDGADECIDFLLVDNEELYREIRHRRIDLLVDLNGRFRLDNPIDVILRRPAPVQVTYGNMLGTYGLKEVQYLLADPYALPEEDECYYTEHICRFESGDAGTFDIPARDILPMPHKESGVFTFGSFNAIFKINDAVISTWAKILEKVPNSRLLIKANGVHSGRFKRRLLEKLDRHLSGRREIVLEPFTPFVDMLDKYNSVDLGLNTFPYSGGTTTAFALWMGVPSLTLETQGEGMVSGGAGGLLRSPGYDEYVVGSIEEYIDKAVALANNPERLEEMRKNARSRLLETARFNPKLFAADFGNQCRKIWRHWLDNAEFSRAD